MDVFGRAGDVPRDSGTIRMAVTDRERQRCSGLGANGYGDSDSRVSFASEGSGAASPRARGRAAWKWGGAAVASSGLKHGAPRVLVEGRAKMAIHSREQETGSPFSAGGGCLRGIFPVF